MHIVIPDDYQDAVRHLPSFAKLKEHTVTIYNDTTRDVAELAQRFSKAEALVLIRERTAITAELLAHLPNLKLISQTGRGITHIDLDACTRHGVAVAVGVGSPYAPAELTWALVMAGMRNLPTEIENLKAGRWQSTLGFGLRGRTLGIFGYGKIGAVVAGYGKAFGMTVMIWGREGSKERARADGYIVASSKHDLFSNADVLSLHIKLSKETYGIVTADDLSLMKTSALLVNTSRAELIQTGALEQALKMGRPSRVAVDVYEQEPALNHPLLTHPNAICTPHLGYVEHDSYDLYFGSAFDHLNAFVNGDYQAIVNTEAIR